MSNNNDNGYAKGFVAGVLIGGAVGAIAALLFAPKSGEELRQDLAEKSGDLYGKMNEFTREKSKQAGSYFNEGKAKAEEIVSVAREKAGNLMHEADDLIEDARNRYAGAKVDFRDNIERLQEAVRAGANAFQDEVRHGGNNDSIGV